MADLREKIEVEKEYINHTLNDLQLALARPEQTIIELAALGTFLLNIYTGIENILKQILQAKNIGVPHTSSSHKNLLALAVKEQILSRSFYDDIYPFLSFCLFVISSFMPTVLCWMMNRS